MKKHLIISLLLIIIAGCTSDNGFAPVSSGSYGKISGTVIDESGSFVPDATITTSPASSTVSSDANGSFQIFKVTAGSYTVTAKKVGYSEASVATKVAAAYASKVQIVLKKSVAENQPPVKPFNPYPQDQSALQSTSFNLSWDCSDPDGDAITYDVYFGTTNPPQTKIAENISEKQIAVNNLQVGKPYYWYVVAKDSKGTATTGDIWHFIITQDGSNHPPLAPSNPLPANASFTTSNTLTLTWDCSDPDGDKLTYDVYFGIGQDFPKVASNQSGKNYYVTNLLPGKTYSWKIVARDEHGAETSGDIWSFSVKKPNNPPLKPSNPIPANNSTIFTANPILQWTCSDPDGDSVYYAVSYGKTQGNWSPGGLITSPILYIQSNLSGKIYWRVRAVDANGAVTEGDEWTFTVAQKNSPPNKPSNPNPSVGAIVTRSDITFSWDCSDPDNDVITYFLMLRTESGDWNYWSNITQKSFTKTGLTDRTKYYWRIMAQDSHGDTTGSDTWYFTTNFETAGFMDKIIAYYQFNGNTNDASGNGYNGKNNGVTFATDRKGNPNACAYFGAGNEYVDVPYPDAFNFKGDFTIALWVKPNLSICKDWDTHIDIIVKAEGTSKWLTFGFTRNLGLEYWTNQQFIGYDMTTLKDMQWNHIAVTFIKGTNGTTGTAILYLNGTQLGATKILPVAVNNTGNLWIGTRPSFNASFGGWLDDIYFFNRALTPAEISSMVK